MLRIAFILIALLSALPAYASQTAQLQEKLVGAAYRIRAMEQYLIELDTRLEQLDKEKAGLEADFNKRRARMADLALALSRLSRMPPEAALIQPGGGAQAARSAMLLRETLPVIEREASTMRGLLQKLDTNTREAADKRVLLKSAHDDLERQHRQLVALTAQRAVQENPAYSDDEIRAIERLAAKASSFDRLLSDIDRMDTPRGEEMPEEGDALLPISGLITTSFGDTNRLGVKAQGLSIEGMAGAVVVAPMGGIVKYAGPFKGYGNIVIIAHRGGYHSLLSGLSKIDVSAGQAIVSGEPIGILFSDQVAVKPVLYYELRYQGRPVNPSKKISSIG